MGFLCFGSSLLFSQELTAEKKVEISKEAEKLAAIFHLQDEKWNALNSGPPGNSDSIKKEVRSASKLALEACLAAEKKGFLFCSFNAKQHNESATQAYERRLASAKPIGGLLGGLVAGAIIWGINNLPNMDPGPLSIGEQFHAAIIAKLMALTFGSLIIPELWAWMGLPVPNRASKKLATPEALFFFNELRRFYPPTPHSFSSEWFSLKILGFPSEGTAPHERFSSILFSRLESWENALMFAVRTHFLASENESEFFQFQSFAHSKKKLLLRSKLLFLAGRKTLPDFLFREILLYQLDLMNYLRDESVFDLSENSSVANLPLEIWTSASKNSFDSDLFQGNTANPLNIWQVESLKDGRLSTAERWNLLRKSGFLTCNKSSFHRGTGLTRKFLTFVSQSELLEFIEELYKHSAEQNLHLALNITWKSRNTILLKLKLYNSKDASETYINIEEMIDLGMHFVRTKGEKAESVLERFFLLKSPHIEKTRERIVGAINKSIVSLSLQRVENTLKRSECGHVFAN